jgi:hypothetical protein
MRVQVEGDVCMLAAVLHALRGHSSPWTSRQCLPVVAQFPFVQFQAQIVMVARRAHFYAVLPMQKSQWMYLMLDILVIFTAIQKSCLMPLPCSCC